MGLSVQNFVTGKKQCEWNVILGPRIESKRICVMMVHDNTGQISRQSLIRRRWLQLGTDGGPGRSRTADLRFRKPSLYPSELRGLAR
jgi:hypothetical protein